LAVFGSVDWGALFIPDKPLLEIFVRGTVMYVGLLVLLRLTPNHETGRASPTNLLVIVLLADAAQNAMAGDYRSITDGLLLVGTLIFWSMLASWLCLRVPFVRWLLLAPPIRLIRNGRVHARNLQRELMSMDDLRSKLRQQGIENLGTVKEAWLEPDGEISVIRVQ
jgi:uncharacterized membrane protein YcaP (DUF421 family)